MKLVKYVFLLAVVFSFGTVFGQETVIAKNDIRPAIVNYVKKHFPKAEITKAVLDKDHQNEEYEIYLSDNTKLEFNIDLGIEKIDGKSALPNSVVPQVILDYVAKNYPSAKVMEWEKNKTGQEVKLTDGTELNFDFDGNFLRVDD